MEQGCFYHIYNRGNNKQPIFFENRNYHHFLKLFDKYLAAFADVYAYCLMPNHFHFLIKVKEVYKTTVVLKTTVVSAKPLENAFKVFFMAYSKGINKAYSRTGALLQQKFKKKEITDDGYFTSIIQYIHANPVAAGLCKTYEDWEFSSYKAIIGTSITKVKREEVIEWFGNKEIFIRVHRERELEREKLRQYLFG